MPSNAYFEELTVAVLVDADEVKGFLQKQSPEERQEFSERMHERIVATFTKLLEVENRLGTWSAVRGASGENSVCQLALGSSTFLMTK